MADFYKEARAGLLGGLAGAAAMNLFQKATRRGARTIDEQASDRAARALPVAIGGGTLHYAIGATCGALYGAAAEECGMLRAGFGSVFGIAFWAGADLFVAPLMGIVERPAAYPVWMHAQALGAHVVYAVTLEAVRRIVR
jgi:hypothetical protein